VTTGTRQFIVQGLIRLRWALFVRHGGMIPQESLKNEHITVFRNAINEMSYLTIFRKFSNPQ
jgi:hypothetical protein